jgi:hypothetical protein
MNTIKRFITSLAVTLPMLITFGGTAHAMIKYNPNGNPTSTTPVFNQFYDVPDGVGNEAEFVRIRPQTSPNSALVTTLNSACNNNDAYTVWNYIHNGADPSFNGNGTGTAVAHNVNIHMTAPLGATSNTFQFTSAISASNAATVTAAAHLNCAQSVKLSLIPGSVRYVTVTHGTVVAPDSAVNGNLSIDGHVAGKDDVWACWEERVAVFYDVKVTVTPPVVPPVVPPTTPTPTQPTPTVLVNTGPGDVAAIFAATTIAGALAYRVFISRRLSRQ